jgi:hypothetical protein
VFSLESRCLPKRERHYWLTKLFDISHLIRALAPCTCTMSPSSYVIWINQPANLCLHCDHSTILSCNLYMAMTFPQAPVHVLYMLRNYVPISPSMWRNAQPCSSVPVVSYKSSVRHWFRYYKRSHLLLCVKVEIDTTGFYSRKLSKTEREQVVHSKANVSGNKGPVPCACSWN